MINNETELLEHLQHLIKDLIHTPNKFDKADAYSESKDLYVELKCRKVHYESLLLQLDKYTYLISKKNSRYVCSTPQGVYSLDPKTLTDIRWIDMLLPKYTEFPFGDKIMKRVAFINLSYFEDITHKLNFKN